MKFQLILSSLILAPLLNLVQPIAIALSQEETQEKAELALAEAELLTSLAGEYATIGQKKQAIALLKEPLSLSQLVVEPCPKLQLLASVAGQYAFLGQKVKSSEIFTQARNILEATEYCGPEPSSSAWSDATTWISVAFLNHARVGQYDTAFQIATGFGDQYIKPIQSGLEYRNAFDDPELIKLNIALQLKLADYYFRTKEFNKARTIWLGLADYYKEKGKSEQATQFHNLASKIEPTKEDNSLNNQSPGDKAQSTLYRCFAESELLRPSASWALTSTLSPRELKPLLDLCKEEKPAEQNIEITKQVFQAIEQISVPVRRISAPIKRAYELAAIANIYGSLKKDAEANKLLSEALSSLKTGLNAKLDDRSEASSALVAIIGGYLNIQRVDQALQVAQMVRAGEIKLAAPDFADIVVGPKFAYDSLMPPIVAFYAKTGKFESALQLANSLGRGHRDEALLRIVQQYVSIGQHDKALQTTQTIKGLEFQNKARVIYDILAGAIESGNLEWARQATLRLNWKAQATASIMQEVEQASASSLVYRDRLLLMIAREYAESKQFTQALNTAAQISADEFGKVLKAEALSAIARQYAKSEQPKEAIGLLNQAVEIARSVSPN